MSGDNGVTVVATGATSATAGIALLPNTAGNPVLMVAAVILTAAGTLIIGSFVAMKLLTKSVDK